MDDPAASWTPVQVPAELRPTWLGSREVRLPILDGRTPRIEIDSGEPRFDFDRRRLLEALREERYAAPQRFASTRLPFDYQRLPGFVRFMAASLVYLPQRLGRARQDPGWPYAPAGDLLIDWLGERPTMPWPADRWGLCITHDVDTVAGLRCCPAIADAVERAGFRSCFYIVGELAVREPAIVRELADRGHEIGSHDVVHDNRLCDLPDVELGARLARARAIIEPFGGSGFRSPSLLRTPRMLRAVAQHFAYDSSQCDTDLEFLRGCASVTPYPLHGAMELPVTLPMDSSLRYVGYGPDRMLVLWREKCRYIRAVGGLAMSVTHAEPHLTGGSRLLGCLERFMQEVAERGDCEVMLPRDVVKGVSGGGDDR